MRLNMTWEVIDKAAPASKAEYARLIATHAITPSHHRRPNLPMAKPYSDVRFLCAWLSRVVPLLCFSFGARLANAMDASVPSFTNFFTDKRDLYTQLGAEIPIAS
jgi:hypothetical protein